MFLLLMMMAAPSLCRSKHLPSEQQIGSVASLVTSSHWTTWQNENLGFSPKTALYLLYTSVH